MGSGEARRGDAKRRARHVVEPQLLAERDGVRITTMLAASPAVPVRTGKKRPNIDTW